MKTNYIKKPTQEERILKFLQQRGEIGVSSWEFTDMGILQYNARIWGLRQKGHDIVNVKKNLYMLVESDYARN